MKTKNIILICFFGIVVLFMVLIATGVIKASLYTNNVSCQTTSTWNNAKAVAALNGSTEELIYPVVSIIVVYKSIIVGDLNAKNPIKVDVSEKDFGSLWSPLFHKSEYNFSVTCKDIQELNTKSVYGKKVINGVINVSGKYKFIGFFSEEIVTNIVVNKVLNDIYQDIKKHV